MCTLFVKHIQILFEEENKLKKIYNIKHVNYDYIKLFLNYFWQL